MRGLIAGALLSFASIAWAAPPAGRAVVVIDSPDPDAWRRVLAALERQGAELPLRLPPDALVGTVPPGVEASLASLSDRVRVLRAGDALPAGLPPNARAAWRFLSPPQAPPDARGPEPVHGDVVAPLPGELARQPKALSSAGCARTGATSAYLVGSVAIGILMPESVGAESTEDWGNADAAYPGQDRQDLVVAKILEGCDTLVTTMPEGALSFTLDVRRSVPIAHEPILHAVGSRDVWMSEVLDAIGHGSASESAGTHGYLESLRDAFGTDWAAAVYACDDLNDADNGFPPTGFPFAYALLGGPYMVMTYDNDGWGLSRMDVVFRHELGHVFGALDEYRSAGNSCSATAGYLRVANGNNDSAPPDPACASSDTCVMRGNATALACPFTRGQTGLRDTDGDGILDVRDAPPETAFEDASPLLVTTSGLTLRARARGLPRGDESPFAPASISMNRVASAEMRLDGGAWTSLVASDGAYGDRCEDLDVTLVALAEGWHDVEVRATNDVGIVEPSPALLRVHVNADCADDASEPDDTLAQAASRPAGSFTLHRCAYDADWSAFRLQAGAPLTATLTPATAGPLTLRLVDPYGAELGRATASAGTPGVVSVTAAWTGTHALVVEQDSDAETDYALDIAAACLDDADEPDSPAPLGRESYPGTLRQRVLCAADEDRYVVSLQAGETLQADLSAPAAFGDLDLEILDPGGAVVASSRGTADTESALLAPTLEGAHVVRVVGRTPADRNLYDLTIAASGCVDDASENDDDLAGARPVAPGTFRGVTCGSDEDWMIFDVPARRLVRALLAHDAAAGNVDLELRASDGRTLLRSTRTDGTEEVTTDRLIAGSYALRVVGTSSARVAWTLELQVEDPLLLFVRKDPADALLSWNRSDQECFTVRRSLAPSDFSAAVTTLVNETDPSVPDGDRTIDDLAMRDRGVIRDGVTLYCYLVDPHDCGASLAASTKTATPSPVVPAGIGTTATVRYDIAAINLGSADAFGVSVIDDLPPEAGPFTIVAIPPGATDASSPAPAGANGTGQVLVTGITVPAGEQRVVSFDMAIGGRTSLDPMVDNQAAVESGASPAVPPRLYPTDDPSTAAGGDDTRVLVASFAQQLVVHAFWHRYVDVDLQVTDPCGNVIGAGALPSASCAGNTGSVSVAHSCAAPSPPSRYERIVWSSVPPPPGDYVVRVAYPGSSPGDPDCAGYGPEEVTVVVQPFTGPVRWQTITVLPGDGPAEALRFTM